jgi:hypothetical protein
VGCPPASAAKATKTCAFAPSSTLPAATVAQLSFVATSPALTFHSDGTATTTVQILNPGPEVAVRFRLVLLPGGEISRPVPDWTAKPLEPGSQGELNTVSLTFRESLSKSITGASLVVSPVTAESRCEQSLRSSLPATPKQPAGAAARQVQTISLSLRRQTSAWVDFAVPLAAGALLAAIFLVSVLWFTRATELDGGLVRAGSSWNFKDSWATNITAGGAIVGTFLTGAGSSSTLLLGIQTSSFALLLATWGGVTVMAPLVLTLGRLKVGNSSGSSTEFTTVKKGLLLTAASLTLVGVGAELATAGVIVHYATTNMAGRLAPWIALIAVSVVILNYSIRTTQALIKSNPDQPKSILHRGRETSLTL